jgi:hypothetical protein
LPSVQSIFARLSFAQASVIGRMTAASAGIHIE